MERSYVAIIFATKEHQSQHTTCFMINLTLKQVVVDTTAVPALYIVGQ